MDDDWVSDARYDELLDREGDLEWIREPIQATHYEAVSGGGALRIRYVQAGTGAGPNHDLAEVVISERADLVAVSLSNEASPAFTQTAAWQPNRWPPLSRMSRFP